MTNCVIGWSEHRVYDNISDEDEVDADHGHDDCMGRRPSAIGITIEK